MVITCLERCLQVANKRVVFFINYKGYNGLTPVRLRRYEEWGWGLTKQDVYAVTKWPGRYYLLVFEKGKPSIIGYVK